MSDPLRQILLKTLYPATYRQSFTGYPLLCVERQVDLSKSGWWLQRDQRTSTGTKLVRWQLEKTFIGHVMWVSFYLSFQTMICSAFNLGFQTVWNHGSKQLLKCRTICKTSSTTKRHLRHFLIEIASCLNKHVGGQPDHCMAAEIDLEIRFPAGFQHKLIQLSFFCSYVAGSLSRKHTFRQEYLASATDGCPRNPGLLEISMSLEAFWISLSLSLPPACLSCLLAQRLGCKADPRPLRCAQPFLLPGYTPRRPQQRHSSTPCRPRSSAGLQGSAEAGV